MSTYNSITNSTSVLADEVESNLVILNDTPAPDNLLDGMGQLYKKTGSDGLFWKPDSAGSEVNVAGASGAVVGPGSSTDNNIPVFDGNTGLLIKDSGVNMTVPEPGSLFIGSIPSVITAGALDNIAYGTNALSSVSSGDNNTASGFNALTNVSSGSQNTAFGLGAGSTLVSGSNNTFVGFGADCATTTAKSIGIGYAAIIDANNQCMIGDADLDQIVPNAGATCDLGSTTKTFADCHLAGALALYNTAKTYATSLLGNASISAALSFVLPGADGTSGQAMITDGSGNLSFSNISPTTTQGDIIQRGSSADERLAIGTAGQVLTVNSGATAVEWAAAGGGGSSATPSPLTILVNSVVYKSINGISWGLDSNTTPGGVPNAIGWNGSNRWVYRGASVMRYSDDDLATFTNVTGAAANVQYSDISYDTGLWLSSSGNTNGVLYSADGITWTNTNITGITNGYGIANNGSGTFVVGSSGTNTLSYTSDGISYTSLGSTYLSTLCYTVKYGNSMFVAAGEDSTDRIATSPDGSTWTSTYISAHTTTTFAIAYSPSLNIWCSAGTGTFGLGYNESPTTQNWTGVAIPQARIFTSIAWIGDKFIAGTTLGDMAYSYDGKNWVVTLYSANYLSLTPIAFTNTIATKLYPKT